ncbi:hypothetical protein DFO83_104213 [Idiomarina loihiensis]|uniref:hypothetical protein n=1 Tax=Idiomarina TaxID=135575 RepID=UPI00054FF9CD|nr:MULTISPECIES: hypothetical protein [Idiomarina]NWO03847.1 hypothetical protein [Idiomarinaceae bacterium]PWW38513.1 hypothetical protein DFO83_104213 [Idiomarina loihiensis]TDP48413.1 hypothetical protein DET58_10490 [Idiomarina loihiensis]TDS23579.1 hypothetical protein DET62_10490 [Idiomarina sp. H2]
MKDLFEKLSTYNIFNYLLPGVVFVAITKSLTKYNFIQEDIVIGVFLYYFIGLVISRVGSIIIEPALKWIEFIKFSEYRDYVEASNKDKLIEVLSEANNMYRTFLSLFLSLSLLKIFEILSERLQFLNKFSAEMAIVGLLLLFAFSYKKQTAYITKRINSAKDKE